MKIALGYRLTCGPWGGGNRFAQSLVGALQAAGHEIFDSLSRSDLDLILIFDPRRNHSNSAFSVGEIFRYLTITNRRVLVVHRINECDERKNGSGMNWRLRVANYCADHTVFVGSWLRALNVWDRRDGARWSVITNGADTSVFNPSGWLPWEGNGLLRLVTHHWGSHWMKGFDIYARLDRMLDDPCWRARIDFTYVGNLPRGFRFRNAKHVPPLDGVELAQEIKRHHGYITASMNEPGGNHQNEGALCGLPLLYRESGCLPEYCGGYGISFSEANFEDALDDFIRHYADLVPRMRAYPHTAARTCGEYLKLFEDLLDQRERIVAARRIWRSPLRALMTQLPI